MQDGSPRASVVNEYGGRWSINKGLVKILLETIQRRATQPEGTRQHKRISSLNRLTSLINPQGETLGNGLVRRTHDANSLLKGRASKTRPRSVPPKPIPFLRNSVNFLNVAIALAVSGDLRVQSVRCARGTNPSTSICFAPGCAMCSASNTHNRRYSCALSK